MWKKKYWAGILLSILIVAKSYFLDKSKLMLYWVLPMIILGILLDQGIDYIKEKKKAIWTRK